MNALFLYCRAGFEKECAAEIQDLAAGLDVGGYCRTGAGSGYVVFQALTDDGASLLHDELSFPSLIFTRQWFVIAAHCRGLPADDRVSALLDALPATPACAASLMVDSPDTNEGKSLSRLGRSLTPHLERALRREGRLGSHKGLRWHVCLVDGREAYLGYALVDNSAPWPMGVPRLRFPRQAPSRSTLKLEEALLTLLGEDERERRLKPGQRAVDLGAAPGGWTWQLTRRGLRVTAVDNGPMDEGVMATGLVNHERADGFSYRPPEPVDWMVCDIVEQPTRVAELAARWLARGWCRDTVFNLKLPMKKRYPTVQDCFQRMDRILKQAGVGYRLRCKQLYHDREEVTVYVQRR